MHVRQTIKEEEDGDTVVRGGAGRNPRFDESTIATTSGTRIGLYRVVWIDTRKKMS